MLHCQPIRIRLITGTRRKLDSDRLVGIVNDGCNRPANQYDLVVFSTIFISKYDSTIFLNKIRFSKKKKNFFFFFFSNLF